MKHDVKTKVQAIDDLEDMTQVAVAEKYDVSRRTINNWLDKEDELRSEADDLDVAKRVQALDGRIGAVAEYEKEYLKKLSDLGDLQDRKNVMVSSLEKILWDHVHALDNQRLDDIRPEVRVRILKDINEIREKLAGEPSVIHEYRAKFQVAVMQVVKEMIPEQADEFLTRIKEVEG